MSAPGKVVFLVVAAALLPAQPAAKFEAASVKSNANGDGRPADAFTLYVMRGTARNTRNGRFEVKAVSLNWLIQLAYNVKDFQVAGGPAWTSSAGFDIVAKAGGDASFEQMRPMLQALLADRFQLVLRRETKEFPVYQLTAAKGGPKIAPPKEGNCVAVTPDGPPPPRGSKICGGVTRQVLSGAPDRKDRIEAFGIPAAKLAELLADEVGRPVIDQTGLSRPLAFRLDFVPEDAGTGTLGPSIFSALQEQLGLRLEAAKAPLEALVIARAEKPGAN